MKFTFLGTGTSQGIPVIGCSCPVCRSSDPRDKRFRTAGLLEAENTNIVFDAGPDFRMQMLQWGPSRLDGIFITHEHNDHIAGLDDIRPYNFMQKQPLKVFAMSRVAEALKRKFDYVFESNPYPGCPSIELIEITPGNAVTVGNLVVEPLEVLHGKTPILGYKIAGFVYLTDVKHIPDETVSAITGVEALVISALRHKPHHSHLTLREALKWIINLTPKKAWLTHLSHEMGKYKDIASTLPQNVMLAYDGLSIGS